MVTSDYEYFAHIFDLVKKGLNCLYKSYKCYDVLRMRNDVKSVYFLNVLPLLLCFCYVFFLGFFICFVTQMLL